MPKTPAVNLADIIDEAELTTYSQTRDQEGPAAAREIMLRRWQKELDNALRNIEQQRQRNHQHLWERVDRFWSWFRWAILAAVVLYLLVGGIARGCAAHNAANQKAHERMLAQGFVFMGRQAPGTPVPGSPPGVKFISALIDSDDVMHLILEVPPPPQGQVYAVSYALMLGANSTPEASGMFVTKRGDFGQLRFEKKHKLDYMHSAYDWLSVRVSLTQAPQ